MKRLLVVFLALALVFTTGIFSLSAQTLTEQEKEFSAAQPDEFLVMTNRFENILNNNYAYGSDFDEISLLVSAAELSLLEKAEDGKLPNSELIAFVSEVYGIDPSVYADEGKEALNKDGETEILPRGYSLYKHSITNFHTNEDGTFTVYSDVEIENHDGDTEIKEAVSRFVKSPDSRFGYYLISSELLTKETIAQM
ncbi:MAG: hypothetical protein U0M42_02920 [Acutalibacteraceae bacterium]|nr:hypothetical protein [Acutalibacteraceae bacterium]